MFGKWRNLVSASALGAGGCGFESLLSDACNSMVECRLDKPKVSGSIPLKHIFLFDREE